MATKKKTEARVIHKKTKGANEEKRRIVFYYAGTSEIVHPNLFSEWMGEKVSQYQEPQREGTPKGDPIGFSRKKYMAALLSLTNLKIKDQAKAAEVSYGVLLKWRTESNFKEMVEILQDEIREHLFDYIIKDQVKPSSKISKMPEDKKRWRKAMCGNFLFSNDLKKNILWVAGSRVLNEDAANKKWWKKRGITSPTKFEKGIFGMTVTAVMGKDLKNKLRLKAQATFIKLVADLLRQHIDPMQDEMKVDKVDALALLEMLEEPLRAIAFPNE